MPSLIQDALDNLDRIEALRDLDALSASQEAPMEAQPIPAGVNTASQDILDRPMGRGILAGITPETTQGPAPDFASMAPALGATLGSAAGPLGTIAGGVVGGMVERSIHGEDPLDPLEGLIDAALSAAGPLAGQAAKGFRLLAKFKLMGRLGEGPNPFAAAADTLRKANGALSGGDLKSATVGVLSTLLTGFDPTASAILTAAGRRAVLPGLAALLEAPSFARWALSKGPALSTPKQVVVSLGALLAREEDLPEEAAKALGELIDGIGEEIGIGEGLEAPMTSSERGD